MLVSLPLLLGLAAATPHAAPAPDRGGRSERPECDEPADDLAAALALPDEEALSPAANEDCSEAPPARSAPPAVIDCNDARAQFWVQEMIGSCAMPRAQFGPHPGDEARHERHGLGAARAPDRAPPQRLSSAGDWNPPLFARAGVLAPPAPSASPLAERAATAPRSRSLDRIERPPRG